jgi:uncharacterized protein
MYNALNYKGDTMQYNDLNEKSNEVLAISASEWHGLLVGYLSLTPNVKLELMPEFLLDVFKVYPAAATLIEDFAKTLSDVEGSLELCLPEDSVTMQDRLQAIKDWVRGFLTGMGIAGFTETTFTEAEINEVITDLSEISELDTNSPDAESNEEFYTEIYEYVRAICLMIALDYHSKHSSEKDGSGRLH